MEVTTVKGLMGLWSHVTDEAGPGDVNLEVRPLAEKKGLSL